MKRVASAIVGLLAIVAMVCAQEAGVKIITHPKLPPREALERMSLTRAWSTRLYVHGQRDGLLSVQVLAAKPHPQILVQTFAGWVTLLDGETGDQLWSVPVGEPYVVGQRAGANANSIFVTRRDMLYVLNRVTGKHRVVSFAKSSPLPNYGLRLTYVPTAAPGADDEAVFIVMNGRVSAYALPLYEALPPPLPKESAVPKEETPVTDSKTEQVEGEKPPSTEPPKIVRELPTGEAPKNNGASPMPLLAWSALVETGLFKEMPLLAGNQLSVVSTGGSLYSLNKFENLLRGEFRFFGKVAVAPGQHGMTAYVAATDATVYAVDMERLGLTWRFLAGGMILHAPAVTDADVFVAAQGAGLSRLRRDNGRETWRAREVERFLAANDRFVYALDGTGEFHVLDGQRGSTLARYDLRDWKLPVANEFNDRIYLANHDGQLLCLHHQELPTPLLTKTPVKIVVPKKGESDPEKKVDEKKVDEKKVDEKKVDEKKVDEKKVDEKKVDEKKVDEKKVDEKKKDDAEKKDARRLKTTPWYSVHRLAVAAPTLPASTFSRRDRAMS